MTPIKNERDAYSAALEEAPWSHPEAYLHPADFGHGVPTESHATSHSRSVSDGVSSRLVRASTSMSIATDDTTGSFHRMLGDQSETYIRIVKRLIKRYTSPVADESSSASPNFDFTTMASTWVFDPDAPPAYSGRPFPLPGDFLKIDVLPKQQCPCLPGSEEHQRRWCMCYVQDEAPHSPWVTAAGLTAQAEHIMLHELPHVDIGMKDSFGNTILHLLATRAPMNYLFEYLQSEYCIGVLNAKNTAGQTFLHVLGDFWLHNSQALVQLLDLLATKEYAQGLKFDLSAADHYGRTWFHMLFSADVSPSTMQLVLERYRSHLKFSRDAFGWVLPSEQDYDAASQSQEDTQPMDIDEIDSTKLEDSRFLENVRLAMSQPRIEDGAGRNGLHCLAAASLSVKSLMDKTNPSPQSAAGRQGRRSRPAEDVVDSSENRLALRLSLAEGLLEADVEPNHYDHYGNTPLMVFCAELPEDGDYKRGPMILELLLKYGANIHARNRAGETALHIAARCGRKLAVKTLIKNGANPHARDAAGRSVLALLDDKMQGCTDDSIVNYSHYEACRAHLSGQGFAVQEPTVMQEWGLKQS